MDADIAINSMMWQNAGRSGIDQWNFVISPEGRGLIASSKRAVQVLSFGSFLSL